MTDMDALKRRHLIADLLRLSRGELDGVIAEVRSRETTEEAGVRALRQAFEQRAAESPFSPIAGLLAVDEQQA
jgi:hypothetical protein